MTLPPVRPLTPSYLHWVAWKIHRRVERKGALQVRWYAGEFLTFIYPAPKGYGVRGEIIGIYNMSCDLQWIEDDLVSFARTLASEVTTPTHA